MNPIITYLLLYIQYLHKQIFELTLFISKYIPLKQWAFDDSNSPDYQKFKIDKLPLIIKFIKLDYRLLLEYYVQRYNKVIKPVNRRNGNTISEDIKCPRCNAPHLFIYDNNGGKGQYQCKICQQTFVTGEQVERTITLKCPHCNHVLSPKKERKHFRVHKCTNNKCSYYRSNLKKLPKGITPKEKSKYKLRYIYREFVIDFFKMNLHDLPNWATSFQFKRKSAHIMGLCLTYHVNLGLSLRKTSQALWDIHNIKISHTMVANYARTASILIKPFVDTYDYNPSNELTADETYIKVKGLKGYVWLIMDAMSRSILGYQVSDNRGVGPCILAMRMAFDKFKEFPGKTLRFVADGYSAYPLACQQFAIHEDKHFEITQVIGLTNDDAVSKQFRPFKQIIERVNRTFKASYHITCGYGTDEGAHHGLTLWVAYYNFLRPHRVTGGKRPLNEVDMLEKADNMPGKWQLLIYLGQQRILNMQNSQTT